MAEYRVDDLARAAGTTTRNVRAYQDRGLLPPPRRVGRVGVYTEAHLARLRLIGSLLERGYATAQITELLSAWEEGKDLADVLGLEQAVTSPWIEEASVTLPTAAVRSLLSSASDDIFERIVGLGLLRVEGDDCVVTSPSLLDGLVQLVGFGFSIPELVELDEKITPAIDTVARLMVKAASDRITAEHGAAWVPEVDEVGQVTDMLMTMRRLANSSLQVFFAHAMEREVESVLGEHLVRIVTDAAAAKTDGAA
jgi:DNA-binding transcriptional MerR regulator